MLTFTSIFYLILKNGKQNLDNFKTYSSSFITNTTPKTNKFSNTYLIHNLKRYENSPLDRGLNISNKILNHFKQLQSIKLPQETYKDLN